MSSLSENQNSFIVWLGTYWICMGEIVWSFLHRRNHADFLTAAVNSGVVVNLRIKKHIVLY